jgi:small-conductance mechanosensitive channel
VWKSLGGTAQQYQTPAQKKAVELAANHNEDGFVDPTQQARHRLVQHLGDQVRSGELPWSDLVKLTYQTDQLKESELKHIQNNIKATQGMPTDVARLYSRAARLPAKEFLDVWDTANTTEQRALQPLLFQVQKKYLNKAKKDMTPVERQQDPTFQRFLNMVGSPPQQTNQ